MFVCGIIEERQIPIKVKAKETIVITGVRA